MYVCMILQKVWKHKIQVDNERGFAQLVSEVRLCVVNAAPCEITADYRTGFTDKMCIKYRIQYIVQP